jgi:hypothetical protein
MSWNQLKKIHSKSSFEEVLYSFNKYKTQIKNTLYLTFYFRSAIGVLLKVEPSNTVCQIFVDSDNPRKWLLKFFKKDSIPNIFKDNTYFACVFPKKNAKSHLLAFKVDLTVRLEQIKHPDFKPYEREFRMCKCEFEITDNSIVLTPAEPPSAYTGVS